MNKWFYFFLFIIVFFSFLSCKVRNKFQTIEIQKVENSILPIDKQHFIFDSLSNSYYVFNNVQFKIDIEIEMPDNSVSLNGTLRMVYDSLIWLSVSPGLGIEAARFQLTPDTVKFLNRLNSTYFDGDYHFFEKNYFIDLDFKLIQSIILNQYFVFPIKTKLVDDFAECNVIVDSSIFRIDNNSKNLLDSNQIWNQKSEIDNRFKILSHQIMDNEGRKLDIFYSDFRIVENKWFPFKISFSYNQADKVFELVMTINKITKEREKRTNFKVPEGYTLIK